MCQLKRGLNSLVDGDVGLRKTVDGKVCAGGALEVDEAADVVVLVEMAERGFDFLARKAKRRKRDGPAVGTGDGKVFLDGLAESHSRGIVAESELKKRFATEAHRKVT